MLPWDIWHSFKHAVSPFPCMSIQASHVSWVLLTPVNRMELEHFPIPAKMLDRALLPHSQELLFFFPFIKLSLGDGLTCQFFFPKEPEASVFLAGRITRKSFLTLWTVFFILPSRLKLLWKARNTKTLTCWLLWVLPCETWPWTWQMVLPNSQAWVKMLCDSSPAP